MIRILILNFLFFTQISHSLAGFDFATIMKYAQTCDPRKWKKLPFAPHFGELNARGAVMIGDVVLDRLPSHNASKFQTEVRGLEYGFIVCADRSFLIDFDINSPKKFREIWKLQDESEDPHYKGWTTSYFFPDNPEVEGPATLHNSHSFHCIVRFEDFIKDYRAVPIDQLCKGESAQTKKKFIENLKRLSETMRKKATSSVGVK